MDVHKIFPGINFLTACQTIHKLDLEPVNAVVVLMDGNLPYHPKDVPYLLNYVKQGEGWSRSLECNLLWFNTLEGRSIYPGVSRSIHELLEHSSLMTILGLYPKAEV